MPEFGQCPNRARMPEFETLCPKIRMKNARKFHQYDHINEIILYSAAADLLIGYLIIR